MSFKHGPILRMFPVVNNYTHNELAVPLKLTILFWVIAAAIVIGLGMVQWFQTNDKVRTTEERAQSLAGYKHYYEQFKNATEPPVIEWDSASVQENLPALVKDQFLSTRGTFVHLLSFTVKVKASLPMPLDLEKEVPTKEKIREVYNYYREYQELVDKVTTIRWLQLLKEVTHNPVLQQFVDSVEQATIHFREAESDLLMLWGQLVRLHPEYDMADDEKWDEFTLGESE